MQMCRDEARQGKELGGEGIWGSRRGRSEDGCKCTTNGSNDSTSRLPAWLQMKWWVWSRMREGLAQIAARQIRGCEGSERTNWWSEKTTGRREKREKVTEKGEKNEIAVSRLGVRNSASWRQVKWAALLIKTDCTTARQIELDRMEIVECWCWIRNARMWRKKKIWSGKTRKKESKKHGLGFIQPGRERER